MPAGQVYVCTSLPTYYITQHYCKLALQGPASGLHVRFCTILYVLSLCTFSFGKSLWNLIGRRALRRIAPMINVPVDLAKTESSLLAWCDSS